MIDQDTSLHMPADVRRRGWFMITGLAMGHTLYHWFIQSFVVALPEIQAAFGLNGVGVGGVLAVRELASGLATLPAGVVVDMLRRYWGALLAVCIGGLGLGALLMGLSPAYPLLLVGIAIVAVSHSIWHLPASASLSHHFPERRGTVLSFHGVGGSIGDVLGPAATGVLLAVLGWRGILSWYAVPPLVLAFVALWAFRGIGGSPDVDPDGGVKESRLDVTKTLLKTPALWAISLVKGLRGMCLVALVTVLPIYLSNDLGLSTSARGFHIALLIAIGIFAKPLAGNLSDRWGRKQVLVPGLAWSCLITLLLIPFGHGIALTVLIVFLGLFLYPDQPILTAATLDIVGRDVASTALGLTAFISFIMSAASPLIAGALYEFVGIEASLFYVGGLFGLAALLMALLPLKAAVAEGP
ncbi:MAG: MFS transporter [Chloroflexi bacterium]|nr:MFS transporter [Chloroflexota bacterium]MDA1227106.1 MFS transporter [Chloroflexota bacterium]